MTSGYGAFDLRFDTGRRLGHTNLCWLRRRVMRRCSRERGRPCARRGGWRTGTRDAGLPGRIRARLGQCSFGSGSHVQWLDSHRLGSPQHLTRLSVQVCSGAHRLGDFHRRGAAAKSNFDVLITGLELLRWRNGHRHEVSLHNVYRNSALAGQLAPPIAARLPTALRSADMHLVKFVVRPTLKSLESRF